MLSDRSILQKIVASSLDGIVVTDSAGVIRACNAGVEGVVGWSVDELSGQPIGALIPDLVFNEDLAKRLSDAKNQVSDEIEVKHKSGQLVILRVDVHAIEHGEEGMLYMVHMVSLSSDGQAAHMQREQYAELRTLTSHIPGAIFRCRYDRLRPFQFVSPAIEDLSGHSPEVLMSGSVAYGDLMRPHDEQRIWREIGQSLRRGGSYTVEYHMRRSDGSYCWVSENGCIVFDDNNIPLWIVGTIADNTLIKTQAMEFEGTVNALNRATAVIEFDMQGCVINANETFLSLMGYADLDEVLGHHHRIFCTPEYCQSQEYSEFWASLRRGEFDRGEYQRIGKNGSEVWIQATYNPIFNADGKPYKVMKLATDLRQRRDMEAELRVAKEQAEAAAEARGNFMANMSHEIRTPMNAIIGFTDVLLEGKLNKEQSHQLNVVRNASRSLLRLLNEILDISKLESGKVELEIRSFSLLELCDHVIASLDVQARQKGLQLILDIDKNTPSYLLGDSLRIQQVLLNLLSNAIKFTEEGSVTLRLCYKDEQLTMQVIDTGIGIDEAYLKRIFDPFTQAEASTSRRFGGTGLGTAISQQLVVLMGGTINVQSAVNEGATFTVELPIPEGEKSESNQQEIVDLPALKLLAVDDNEHNLELIKAIMDKGGHEVELAGDGQDAVDACLAHRYDIVLMDLQMPQVDGLEAVRIIRENEKSRRENPVPILAFSASVLERDRQAALAAGMDGFVYKPLNVVDLFHEIARVLGLEADNSVDMPAVAGKKVEPATDIETVAVELPDLPDINWEAGLKLWDKRDVLIKAIHRFLNDSRKAVVQMQQALEQNKLSELAAAAHKMCGAAGNLSLAKVHALSKRLEEAGNQNEPAEMKALIESIGQALEAVDKALLSPSGDALSVPGGGKKLNRKRRTAVRKTLAAMQSAVKVCELPVEHLNALKELLPEVDLQRLQHALDHFDFDEAQKCLDVLQGKYTATRKKKAS